MDSRDIRSTLSLRRRMTRTRGSSLTSLLARAMGRALGLSASSHDKFEHLEPRQLLEGSFANPLPLPNPDADGRVVVAGTINPALINTNNDTYRFVAPASGFVTALADTSNEVTASSLDTTVEVWNAAGTTLIASGSNNGTLTSGFQRDGWAGFVATAGTEYRIVVKSDPGSPQGAYTLRMRATNSALVVGGDTPDTSGLARPQGSAPSTSPDGGDIDPIVGQLGGTGPLANRLRQDEIIYSLTLPNEARFNSLVTVNAMTTQTDLLQRLDTHLDIYRADGTLLTSDEQTGRINNAFTAFKGTPGATYFIRVRSDEVRTANKSLAVGTFFLQVDTLADNVPLDLLTRRGQSTATQTIYNTATPALVPALPQPARGESVMSSFIAQGSGQAIITLTAASDPAITDIAVRLYNDAGELVAFNDNFAGRNPQLDVNLVGNQRYFIVTDFFSDNNQQPNGARPPAGPDPLAANIFIEANHTFTQGANQEIDDHVDSPFSNTGTNLRRDLASATPLPWSQPFLTRDRFGNELRDRGLRVTTQGEGRIYRAGDTDLFQFTAPYDMLATYDGNDDDIGTSLYIGGAFDIANANSAFPTRSRNVTIWDAADYWYTGDQRLDEATGTQFGFVDNPATVDTDGPQVRVMYNWAPVTAQGVLARRVVVGGDFILRLPNPADPNAPIEFTNLAVWTLNTNGTAPTGDDFYEWQNPLGTPNGPVFAVAEFDPVAFDPDDSGPLEEIPDDFGVSLFIGGAFTQFETGAGPINANNLIGFDFQRGNIIDNTATNGGAPGPVRALAVFDAPDAGAGRAAQAGPPVLNAVADPGNPPISLYVGGEFQGGIRRWTGADASGLVNINVGTPVPTPAINGSVFSLQVFEMNTDDRADLDQDPDEEAGPQPVLFIGGDFTINFGYNLGGAQPAQRTSNNLVAWGLVDELQDVQNPVYTPRLQFANPLPAGFEIDGAVNALTVWNPPNLNGVETPPQLMVGGEFDFVQGADVLTSNIMGLTVANFDAIDGGADGPVFALATQIDEQEPGIATQLVGGPVPQEVLYIGGRFTNVGGADAQNVAIRQARIVQGQDVFVTEPLQQGVTNDPAFTDGPAAVFALTNFDDGIGGQFDRHDRAATRLSLTLNPTFGASTNMFVRVFDSNGTLIYENDTIAPPFPDPAGMIDPSLAAPNGVPQDIRGIPVWGGETYYVEISASNPGRYTFTVGADAGPTDVNGDGIREDINNTASVEVADESRFTAGGGRPGATELQTANVLATGDTFAQVEVIAQAASLDRANQRPFPSTGIAYSKRGDQGLLQTIDDTDLYFFRAEFTGTAEIRVGTMFIEDEYITRVGTTNVDALPKTYNSRLDAAIRVFGNDFVQLAYNNDNSAYRNVGRVLANSGDFVDTADVGTFAGIAFRGEDPYVTIPVVAGQTYFIQVESGQRWRNGQLPPPASPVPVDQDPRGRNIDREIDWRRAAGSYQLLVNAMPEQFNDIESGNVVVDDHADNLAVPNTPFGAFATPISINQTQGNSLNGTGSITGVINNTPQKPVDVDTFRFIAPGNGTANVRLTRTTGSTLTSEFTVFRENGAAVGTGIQQGGGTLDLSFAANPGDVFIIQVNGQGASEGGYRIDVTGMPFVDDFANANQAWNAATLPLTDFLGTGSIAGDIEQAGDTDIFRFQFPAYQRIQFRVEATQPGFNPRLTVYEVTENSLAQVIYTRVGVGETTLPPGNAPAFAQTVASITPARSRGSEANGDFREYPFYYIVVEGASPVSDRGAYTLSATFAPTDDYPDADTNGDGNFDNGEAASATPVVLDALTGTATAPGRIEVPGDTDLVRFILPTEGVVSVTLARTTDSFLRGRVSLLKLNVDGTFTTLAQATMPDSLATNGVTATFDSSTLANVNRGELIYIAVDAVGGTTNTVLGTAGAYTLAISAPPLDDHANRTEWELASIIPIDGSTGRGQVGSDAPNDIANPRINPAGDDDLFTFTVLSSGVHNITLTPYISTLGTLAPRIRIYRDDAGTFNLIGTVNASAAGQAAVFTVSNAAAGQRYFVLVDAQTGLAGANPIGEYRIVVQGPAGGGGGGGGGNDPSIIDFNNPTTIILNTRTGDGSSIGSTTNPQASIIQPAFDRDLYAFTTAAPGRVFLRLSTPTGSTLDAQIQVLRDNGDGTRTAIAADADGLPGSTAQLSFGSPAGVRYFVIVDGLGESVGGYQLDVQTEAAVKRLVYPEGFASDTVSEFVPIVNPNVFPVDFRITLYYDDGTTPTQLPGGTMLPNSRDGYTINAVVNGQLVRAPGVIPNKPYSVVLEWTVPTQYVNSQGQTVPVDPATIQPLGATLSHYDFGSSTGDAFTETVASTWNFARVERNPGAALNYILFWNPHNYEVDVTLTAFLADGSRVTLPEVRRVRPLGREGFGINDFPQLGTGIFGAQINATPVATDAQLAAQPFEGVVASITAYRFGGGNESAFGALGDAQGGTTKGAITNITNGNGVTSEITFFNPSSSPATVNLSATYIRNNITASQRTIQVPAGRSVTVTGASLGLVAGDAAGIRYTADLPVSVLSYQSQRGDADAASPQYVAGNRFFFGDAFINGATAGRLYFETLYFYNPTNITNNATVNIIFYNEPGTNPRPNTAVNISIPANGFQQLRLHELQAIVGGGQPSFFAIDITGALPFQVTMEHYDLFLGGGWSAAPVPFGIRTPLSSI